MERRALNRFTWDTRAVGDLLRAVTVSERGIGTASARALLEEKTRE